jgi:methionine-rich copper-binding protein CopC
MVLFLAMIVDGTVPALAHAHLTHATPAANAVVQDSPANIQLQFSEGIEPKFAKVAITGANGTRVPTGTPTLDPNNKILLIVPITGPLSPGSYKVDWSVVSTDTHKVKGSYSFTVKK